MEVDTNIIFSDIILKWVSRSHSGSGEVKE